MVTFGEAIAYESEDLVIQGRGVKRRATVGWFGGHGFKFLFQMEPFDKLRDQANGKLI
jgi:hypothetical protein